MIYYCFGDHGFYILFYLFIFFSSTGELMKKYMDTSANPCQDFYRYACGNWDRENPIPKDKAGYDTFEILRESLDKVLKGLLDEGVPDNLLNSDDAITKAKLLYQSCMNTGTCIHNSSRNNSSTKFVMDRVINCQFVFKQRNWKGDVKLRCCSCWTILVDGPFSNPIGTQNNLTGSKLLLD